MLIDIVVGAIGQPKLVAVGKGIVENISQRLATDIIENTIGVLKD